MTSSFTKPVPQTLLLLLTITFIANLIHYVTHFPHLFVQLLIQHLRYRRHTKPATTSTIEVPMPPEHLRHCFEAMVSYFKVLTLPPPPPVIDCSPYHCRHNAAALVELYDCLLI